MESEAQHKGAKWHVNVGTPGGGVKGTRRHAHNKHRGSDKQEKSRRPEIGALLRHR
jgi:hypothetical protein